MTDPDQVESEFQQLLHELDQDDATEGAEPDPFALLSGMAHGDTYKVTCYEEGEGDESDLIPTTDATENRLFTSETVLAADPQRFRRGFLPANAWLRRPHSRSASGGEAAAEGGDKRRPAFLQEVADVAARFLAMPWARNLRSVQWLEQRISFGAKSLSALVTEIITFTKVSAGKRGDGRLIPWLQAGVTVGVVSLVCAGFGSAVASAQTVSNLSGSYWLARILAVRWLSGVALVAFLVAYYQNRALIGDAGILPARHVLATTEDIIAAASWRAGAKKQTKLQRTLSRLERQPTLLWLAKDWNSLDIWLDRIALAGAALALLAFVRGGASAWHWLAMWMLYHSLVAVGQLWYSFGWESLLLECMALAVLSAPSGLFACTSTGASFPWGAAPPIVAVWAWRWMAFRIMLGAGLIKVRGASSWKDLTAMCYHLETQPIPNPLSRYLHNLPRQAHLYATAANHVVELYAPWLFLVPWRPAQVAAGAIHIAFQLSLILSGNLAFLNWLTIVPALWCFDDAVLAGLMPSLAPPVEAARAASVPGALGWIVGLAMGAAAVTAIVWLSIPVCINLLGPAASGGKQRMNSSFDRKLTIPGWLCRQVPGLLPDTAGEGGAAADVVEPARKRSRRVDDQEQDESAVTYNLCALRLLNTYGAFGSVNKERIEIIFEGTRDASVAGAEWHPYTFKAAVDDPMKRPGLLAPYHLRLDWCRWIAACRGRRASGVSERWVLSFVAQLLQGSPGVRSLLARDGDPFAGGAPPRMVRAELYLYHFAPPPRTSSDPYWQRTHVGQYLPPQSLEDLRHYALN